MPEIFTLPVEPSLPSFIVIQVKLRAIHFTISKIVINASVCPMVHNACVPNSVTNSFKNTRVSMNLLQQQGRNAKEVERRLLNMRRR